MNKLAIIPIFFLTMCGTTPITDDAAHACSLPLDGSPANCPDHLDKPLLVREEMRGDVDIYNPEQWMQIQGMFLRNARRTRMEQNMTLPADAINSALDNFWEQEDGSNGSTESEKLL